MQNDLKFLKEMQWRIDQFRNGDQDQLEFVEGMVADWIDELEKKLGIKRRDSR